MVLYSPYIRLEAAWDASTSIPRERRIEDVRVKWGTDSADSEDGGQENERKIDVEYLSACGNG
jgi:hypothetical protein